MVPVEPRKVNEITTNFTYFGPYFKISSIWKIVEAVRELLNTPHNVSKVKPSWSQPKKRTNTQGDGMSVDWLYSSRTCPITSF